LPKPGSGLMRPAVDSRGRLWFGEMSHNFLTMFDPGTQTFEQITPPHGAYSVMGVVVATDDTVWFAEQDANYIGRYFPDIKRFQTYNLPTLSMPDPGNTKNRLSLPSAPNDLAFDGQGNIWFTEMNADALAMLNVHTGSIKQYPLSNQRKVQTLAPYGVTVDHQGMIWFTESTTSNVGRLDPTTGSIHLFTMQGPSDSLMEITSDAHGIVWATSFNENRLIKLDPKTGVFTSYNAPSTGQGTNGLYGLLITSSNEVWVTVPAENAIAHLDKSTNHFTYYHIPTAGSFPLGVVMSKDHTLWFTEAGGNKIGMLKL